ncbi:helix-turn-helix domain-containing protein [Streptomyces sp. NPDC055085]
MEQNALGPTRWVAHRVRAVRERRGLTAQQVADALNDQGVGWQRSTVAKLESGRRENLSVAELLALSVVLEVAPVHLLVPTEDGVPYQTTPGSDPIASETVRRWVRGEGLLPGADARAFWSEIPEAEFRLLLGAVVPGE